MRLLLKKNRLLKRGLNINFICLMNLKKNYEFLFLSLIYVFIGLSYFKRFDMINDLYLSHRIGFLSEDKNG